MSFIWPTMLFSLALIPLFAVLYARVQRRRRQIAAAYGSLGVIQAAGRPLGARRHIPPALFLAGLAILLLGTARPQARVSLPRLEGTVILAFDVSRSMAAEDAAPSRMEAARAAALAFVAQRPAMVRVGVVAFSDSGIAVQAPTDDQAAIVAAIERLAPERGTSLGEGLLSALNTLAIDAGQEPIAATSETAPAPIEAAAILMFSDGENNGAPEPQEAAQQAAERGVIIHAVGIGSPSGTSLEIDGFTVHTALDEATLREVAEIAGGAYYAAAESADGGEPWVAAVYENLGRQLVVRPDATEITALFAGAGLLVLLIGGICSLVWFSRLP